MIIIWFWCCLGIFAFGFFLVIAGYFIAKHYKLCNENVPASFKITKCK